MTGAGMGKGLSTYRSGVDYTPNRSWWYCWNDFDADAVSRDLDAIASIGADHIRIMLVWPYFQPNPKTVSERHLELLDALMRLAVARRIDVCASLFVGWLSGYAFKPPFQADDSFYRISQGGSSQELYVRRVAEVMRMHDNFLGVDLGMA